MEGQNRSRSASNEQEHKHVSGNMLTPELRSWVMPLPQKYRLIGFSRAGWSTGFYIPDLDWCLDAGVESNWHPERIFITHGHSDHSDKVPVLWSHNKPSPTFYAPDELIPFLRQYAVSSQQLNDCSTDQPATAHCKASPMIGLKHNEEVMIQRGKHQQWVVKGVAGHHRVPERAYLFSEVHKKLKEEFKSLKGNDIGKLAKEGKVEMYDTVRVPQFAYLGDTLSKIFETSPEILTYPIIITECTFLFDQHLPQAHNATHIHWLDIEPLIVKHPQITWVLIHFSPRYTNQEISQFFENVTEKGQKYRNIYPWI